MQERKQILNSILTKASEDAEFRSALLADPSSAIGREFEIDVPDSINIVVHENDSNTVHLTLPARPMILDEGDLAQVSAGACLTGTGACG